MLLTSFTKPTTAPLLAHRCPPTRQLRPKARGSVASRPTAAMVQYVESERVAECGHKLFTVAYLPDAGTVPTAVVCFHHGIGEHIGRYTEAFNQFADAGIAVYSFDAVGHGKSEGHRALVTSFPEAVDEFLELCKWAKEDTHTRFPGASLPMFIAGHSLGGLVAATACLRDQGGWAGLLLCSPALDVQLSPVLKVQAAMGNVLAAIIPKACIVPAVNPNDMNPIPELVQQYITDPLNTVGNLPIRTGNEVLKGMRYLRQHWPEFTLPIYLHHGDADKCTSPPGSQAFVAAVGSSDKTFNLVPGGFHEVLLTPGVKEELLGNMTAWIKQHATAPAAAAGGDAAAAAAGSGGGAPGEAAAKM